MTNSQVRRTIGVLLVSCLALPVAACGGSGDGAGAGGKVTVTVNGQPPKTQAFERKLFDADVAEFERTHPNIDLQPKEGFMEVEQFSAKLAGGQLEDVFYVYFTDPASIIARRQAADITDEVRDIEQVGSLRPELLDVFRDDEGKLYGLPTANYSMGLLYSRPLFTKAGLDPDDPPRTWPEVREAARKISALGEEFVGFAELSKSNQGGWHFGAWLNSLGGQVAREENGTPKADFNNEVGRTALRHLHDMRWADDSMGSKQLLEAADVQRMMGAGQVGMFLAAPDNIPTLVKQFNGDYADYGLAPMPGGKGTLIGGEGYMVNPKASPEKVEAGLRWIQWRYLNPDRFDENARRFAEADQPVGLPAWPTADIWRGEVRKRMEAVKAEHANLPAGNYEPFMAASTRIEGHLEPPKAQQVYARLDTVMQACLTDPNADPGRLLAEAEADVDAIFAQIR